MKLKINQYLKSIVFYNNLLILIFGFLLNCKVEQDPRLIKNHKISLITLKDTLRIDELKLINVNLDTIPCGRIINLSQKTVNSIISDLLEVQFNYRILEADLYINYRPKKNDFYNWRIHYSEVKYLSVFYIKNDKLNFDFYDFKNNEKKSYVNLSDGSCNTSLIFLVNHCNTENNCSLLTLTLSESERPNKREIQLGNKENDSLYKLEQNFYEKLK